MKNFEILSARWIPILGLLVIAYGGYTWFALGHRTLGSQTAIWTLITFAGYLTVLWIFGDYIQRALVDQLCYAILVVVYLGLALPTFYLGWTLRPLDDADEDLMDEEGA